MTKTTAVRMGSVAILVLGIAIGYVASQTGFSVAETASAQTSAQATSEEGGAKSATKDGPSSKEMMKLMRALGIQNNVVLIEISEYNPMIDSKSNQTALVVRNLKEHYLYGLAARMRGIKDPLYYHPDMIHDGR